jgi:hypothetical protein
MKRFVSGKSWHCPAYNRCKVLCQRYVWTQLCTTWGGRCTHLYFYVEKHKIGLNLGKKDINLCQNNI